VRMLFNQGLHSSLGLAVAIATGFAFFSFRDVGPLPGFAGVVFGVVVGAVALAWWVFDIYRELRYRSRMRTFAVRHGWKYEEQSSYWSRRLGAFPFGQGSHRRDIYVLTGMFGGLECSTFVHEFHMRIDDKRRTRHQFQITTVKLPFPMRRLDIVAESSRHKVSKWLGGEDIEFESAEFNKKWRVMAPDKKFAHDFVDPRMMERLNQIDAIGLNIRIENDILYTWQSRRQPLSRLATRLGVIVGMVKRIPAHLYREYEETHHRHLQARDAAEARAPEWARDSSRLIDRKFNPEFLDPDEKPDFGSST